MSQESGRKEYIVGGKKYFFPLDGVTLDQYTRIQSTITTLFEGATKNKMTLVQLVSQVFQSKSLYDVVATLLVPEDASEWSPTVAEQTKKEIGKMRDVQIVDLLTHFFVGRIDLMTAIQTSLDDFRKKKEALMRSQEQ